MKKSARRLNGRTTGPVDKANAPGRRRPEDHRVRQSRVHIRRAETQDIPTLVRFRHRMFADMGGRTESAIRAHDARYRSWVRSRIQSGELVALLAEDRDRHPIATGSVWFRETHPTPHVASLKMPYILSVFTEPTARRKGTAGRIVRELVRIARSKGYEQVRLNASDAGMGVYAKLGFERTTEMRRYLNPKERRKARPIL